MKWGEITSNENFLKIKESQLFRWSLFPTLKQGMEMKLCLFLSIICLSLVSLSVSLSLFLLHSGIENNEWIYRVEFSEMKCA